MQEQKKLVRVRGVSSRNNYMAKRKAIFAALQEQREVRDQFGRLVIDEDRQDTQEVAQQQQQQVQQPQRPIQPQPAQQQPPVQQQRPQQQPQRSQQQTHWEESRRDGWTTPHSRRIGELVDQVVLLKQELDLKQRRIDGLEQQLRSEQQQGQQGQQLIVQQQLLIQQIQVQVAQYQREEARRGRRPSPEQRWKRRTPERRRSRSPVRRRSRSPLNRMTEATTKTATFQVVRERPQQSMKSLVEEFLGGQPAVKENEPLISNKTSIVEKQTIIKPPDTVEINIKAQENRGDTTQIAKSKSSITIVPKKSKQGAQDADKALKTSVESKPAKSVKAKSSSLNPTVKLHRMVENMTLTTPPPSTPAPAILEELSQPMMDPL